jgi:hypothetical protein
MSSEHEASGPEASRPGSTVLARMIQRIREPRPWLEPVIQPLFAPRADRFAPGDDPAPDAPSPDVLPPEAPSPDVLPPDAPRPDVRPPEAFPPYVRPPEARSPDVLLPEASDAVAELPERPVTSTPGGRDYPPGGRARASGRGAGPPAAPEFPSPAGGFGPAATAFAAGFTAEDDLASDDGLALLLPGPPSRREYRSEQRSYQSVARAAGVGGDGAGGREPPVTITIGHIEVRAAPVPPRPQAPPRPKPAFRPQTTLADFLDGSAGRPGGSGRR